MPRLSVIMPVYNSQHSVSAAIKSTLASLTSDSELIIVNDASTDASQELINSIDDTRLRLINNSSNLGVAQSLSRLLDEVDSPYVARMDADDICLPWRFHIQERHLIRNHDADIVFGGVVRFGSSRLPSITLPIPYSRDLALAMLPLRNPFIHPTMLARTDALRRIGGYMPGPAEDFDLWLRAADHGVAMHRLAIPVICYRHHVNQVSSQKKYARETFMDPILQRNLNIVSAKVYPGLQDGAMWDLLEHRLLSTPVPSTLKAQLILSKLSDEVSLTRWELSYLRRRVYAAFEGA